MRYPPEHKAETRRRILREAARSFKSGGFHSSSIKQLMARAGLTVGGFYNHFSSKEDLLHSVLDEALDTSYAQLTEGSEDLSGAARVAHIGRRYLSRSHRDAVAEGCPLPSLLAELRDQPRRLRCLFDRYLERFTTELRTHLPERPGLPAQDTALAMAALSIGGLILSRAVAEPGLSDALLSACKKAVSKLAEPQAKPSREGDLPS